MSLSLVTKDAFNITYDNSADCWIMKISDSLVFASGERNITLSQSGNAGQFNLTIPESIDLLIFYTISNIFSYSNNVIYNCMSDGTVHWRSIDPLASGDHINFRYLMVGSYKKTQ